MVERNRYLGKEKKLSKETKLTYTGDLEVLSNIIHKKPDTHIVGLFLGGGQAGVVGAGFAEAFSQAGLVDNIDTYIGLSSGSAVPYGLLGGCVNQIKDIYHQENIEYELFNWKRIKNIFARERLEEALREKMVNHNYLRSKRSDFFVGVTDVQTGKGEFLDVKQAEDPLRLIMASMNMPHVTAGPIQINRNYYVDGGLYYPLPVVDTARQFTPTDILVVEPLPFDAFSETPEKIAYFLSSFGMKDQSIELLKTRRLRYQREIPFITGEKKLFNKKGEVVRVLALHPHQTSLDLFTMNTDILQQGLSASKKFTETLLSSLGGTQKLE